MKNFGASDFISLVKNLPDLDADYAIDTIGGSEELYEKILKKAIQLLPGHIEQMDVYISACGDLSAFAVKTHGVKGSLNQIGAFRLAKLAELLEKEAKAENRQYCAAHYNAFRDEAMRLHSLLSEASARDIKTEASRNASGVDRENLFDALLRAEKAVAEFDTLLASKILAPFTEIYFDAHIDSLISQAAEALDRFNPGKASIAIAALLKGYETPKLSNGEDETL